MKKQRVRAWIVGVIAIVVSVVVFLVPFAFVVLQSAKTPDDASTLAFTWPQEWQFFDNLVAVLQSNDGLIWRAFFNSAVLTVGSVIVMVILSAMAGYVLARKRSKWGPLVNFFVLAGLIVPPAVVPTIWVLQGVGLYKTMPGMILIEATFGLSFCILMFRSFFGTVPRELDEAAVLDGASRFRVYWSIAMPLSKAALAALAIFVFLGSWNDFLWPFIATNSNEMRTLPVGLTVFVGEYWSERGLVMAGATMATVPVLIVYAIFQRQIIQGFVLSGLKG